MDTLSEIDQRSAPVCRIREALPVLELDGSRDADRDATNAPSRVEQPAHSFTSIHAMNKWLNAQGDAANSPELQQLRAAIAVFSQKQTGAKREQVRALCSAWGVHRRERQMDRPLATMIADLKQAFLIEGTRFRAQGLVDDTRI